uniref:NLP1-9 GAF domain-containing protein n=1 Tax=Arundo donax TaxID=35708 RepID=A0A0A9F632_ARUDO
MDGVETPVCGDGGLVPDIDPFMLSGFDDLESYTEFSAGPLAAESILSAFSFSPEQQLLRTSPSLPHSLNSDGQSDASITEGSDRSRSLASGDLMDMSTATVSRQIIGATLPEKMLRALAMLKEASDGGAILAQVWMPVRNGEHRVLTTSDQPFLLDERLSGYREVSRQFTFSATEGPGLFPGLPGRVFLSGMPEWTSNVMYYSSSEYLRVDHAMRHEVRGSLALPVFDSSDGSCCAVLELVMTQEKNNFCTEIDDICNALQVFDVGKF